MILFIWLMDQLSGKNITKMIMRIIHYAQFILCIHIFVFCVCSSDKVQIFFFFFFSFLFSRSFNVVYLARLFCNTNSIIRIVTNELTNTKSIVLGNDSRNFLSHPTGYLLFVPLGHNKNFRHSFFFLSFFFDNICYEH